MKRLLASTLVIGTLALPVVGLVGCGDEAMSKTKETVSSPGGTTTTTTETKVNSSGSNPPANSAGERVEPKK
jgi:hypothetical protein